MECLSEFFDIESLKLHVGEKVKVRAWVHNIRTFPKHSFIIIRDGVFDKSKVQIYAKKNLLPENLTVESYISVIGTVQELPEGKYSYQPFEIFADQIEVLSLAQGDFSSKCPDNAGVEIQLSLRHLYLRSDRFAAITKLRSLFLRAIRSYFDDSGCTEIVPPCFVGNQCEGGATLFKLDHVGQPAYLTQSSQFYLEYAVPAVGDCYCIYPSFRAENSQTRRHLTEFLHAEAEWRDVLTMADHVKKLRDMMIGILVNFLQLDEDQGRLLKQLGRLYEVEKLLEMVKEGIVMTHKEAIEYCREHNIYKDEESKSHFYLIDDIPEAQERKMIDQIGKVVFLVRFPAHFKSFYMKSCEDDPTYVEGCDVEVPGVGEIIGSGIRVSDPDELIERIKQKGLKEDEYTEYIDMRRYGHGQTSGMGMGVDRMLTWLLGAFSIRDVVTFPRYPGRLTP